MKNEIIILFLLLIARPLQAENGFQLFDQKGDISFENVKVNLKKIQKKQIEPQESVKEVPKQSQTGKSQKELLEEQLQQIEKYKPSNITVEGGRVFTQSQQNQQKELDENSEVDEQTESYDEDEIDQEDEVLLAIQQISADAQLDAIEFIFKKRQIDYQRMKNLIEMIDQQEINVKMNQIYELSSKYSFLQVFQQVLSELHIEFIQDKDEDTNEDESLESSDNSDEQSDNDIDTNQFNEQQTDFTFDDLIDFDDDELQDGKSDDQEETSQDQQDDFDFYDDNTPEDLYNQDFETLELDDSQFQIQNSFITDSQVNQSITEEETNIEVEEEELLTEEEHAINFFEFQKQQQQIEEELVYSEFEELIEQSYSEEEEEEFHSNIQDNIQNSQEQSDNQESYQQPLKVDNPIFLQKVEDIILSKEEQDQTYIDENIPVAVLNFQENDDVSEVKLQKEFEFSPKKFDNFNKDLSSLQAQFNISNENLDLINKKYEQMNSIFNSETKNEESDPLQKKEQQQAQFIQISQQTEENQEEQSTSTNDQENTNQNEESKLESEVSNENTDKVETIDNRIQENSKENQKQADQEPEVEKQKNDDQVQQEYRSPQKQQIPLSKPAQPHELEFEKPQQKQEKSEEEIAQEKEMKARARYAKRYQALDVENEEQKKKEQEETHYVDVDKSIDDIFIIQSLASTKKNNVIEMKNLNEEPKSEPLQEPNQENDAKIEVYNSVTQKHLSKANNQKTQHFVEAFVQDMSLKSYTCDPSYYGPNKEARQFACQCSSKIFLLDEESWYLAGTIQYYKQYEKLFEQIKKTIPLVFVGTSKDKVCFSSQMHQPVILNDFLRELFFKTKIQNKFIQIPTIISMSYMQLEYSDNQIHNFMMEAESNDEIKLAYGFNVRQILMKLAQENLNIQYVGSFLVHQQQVPFRLTNQYGSLKIDTMEITVQLPQDELICLQICEQILSGDVAQQLKAFINFKKGQYQITVKVLSSNESFEIFYSLKS
ncbi:unnamed protein product (macronuclear) [Paramecium tetraurelia]|uniref:Uncharacterized protein n=1 Tax=Paramecium tetraurelia TaxID=5888 RepID=A0DU69_PARTE|nr:uncharacterized protein GSPATT00020257001 [Paramecium tetraurelia]CAK86586.1 unnamed protein product [Paramecium tetraurelia]|eukprot:XP_001453983.1 hypothetical protein (macronuclear) [Paramecium tetraurelia strain d4-2]